MAPSDAFVGWLPQEHQRIPGETVAAYIARRTGCSAATTAMDAAAEALADGVQSRTADPADLYATALDHWLATGAADLDERLPPFLADLGLDSSAVQPDFDPDDGIVRRAVGAGRVGRADAVAVRRRPARRTDERSRPRRTGRLEDFVRDLRGGVVLVSHDREFLARSVTRVLELDLAQEHHHRVRRRI